MDAAAVKSSDICFGGKKHGTALVLLRRAENTCISRDASEEASDQHAFSPCRSPAMRRNGSDSASHAAVTNNASCESSYTWFRTA